jgi:hypothetical protein
VGLIARRGHPYIPFDPADISHIEVTHRKWEFQQKGTVKNPDAILTAGRPYDAVIRVYDKVGNVIETHEHASAFKEW